ncbi:hypothetical protein BU16DRAFT_350407 [Lophium mytilinum]|uniref:Uncharacterized protein n=1 Tax=Lophium mytilinum TaxID=390894 RepID=A0A6A6QXF2_9PEZI|nr:hypothetical protein BU16DRAFT_350407 [Lophium mytilinum]
MSFIAKSLSAVGSRLFTTSTAPDGHKTLEASPEESDAGSPGSSHEHPHKHRAKHQHNPQVLSSPTSPVRHITSTASGLRRPSNRRRESKSDLADEKRLLGDYTTPADAVIITPPNATTFKKHKPITGGHRPMNTMAGPMISNIQVPPRAAQRTYGDNPPFIEPGTISCTGGQTLAPCVASIATTSREA